MPYSREVSFKELRRYLRLEYEAEQKRAEQNRRGDVPRDRLEDDDRILARQMRDWEERAAALFDEILTFPPIHEEHHAKLAEFHKSAPYERSVFVMTKYSEPDPAERTPLDGQLDATIAAVCGAVRKAGFKPRLASDKWFDPMIWKNIEVYLLGCKYGIAIVEDRYRKELNPNVAMEWGWMRALKREVLYLVEKDFGEERADVLGFGKKTFDWAAPKDTIPPLVKAWLKSLA